jgi:hypothetical protein
MKMSEKAFHALFEGTRVRVVWHGGNGPHEYTIKHDSFKIARMHDRFGAFVGTYDDALSIEVVP